MNSSKLFDLLVQIVKELDESGDIVVVNPIENAIPKKILSVIERSVPSKRVMSKTHNKRLW